MISSPAIAFRAESNGLMCFVFYSVTFIEGLVCDRLRLDADPDPDPQWPLLPRQPAVNMVDVALLPGWRRGGPPLRNRECIYTF